jgi:cytochrome c oxidase assembly factor CtaG
VLSWCAAAAVVAVALVGPVGVYGETLFWVHMVQHLALIMVVPVLVVWAQRARRPRRCADAAFAARLLSRPAPIAWPFFSSLQLPYVPDLLVDQRRGALLAWAIGDVPTLVAVAVLVVRWTRGDRAEEAAPSWAPSFTGPQPSRVGASD